MKPTFLFAFVSAVLLSAHGASPSVGQDAESGFESLFDGKTLKGWDGDPRFWRVEDGVLVGETSEQNAAEQNTFLIYRGQEFGNFELRFEYQVRGYNSGVQYRSVDRGNWVISGYQADFEARWHESDSGPLDRFSGMFFEEQGRMFLGQRGDVVIVRNNPDRPRKPRIEKIGTVGDAAELESVIRRDDWNQYRILARGYQFTHLINGRVMALGYDEDAEHRRAAGLLAFQLHSGPPMQIRVRNIRIRTLDDE